MPSLGPGQYLAEAFSDLGRAALTGFGPAPLSWSEIDAYARLTDAISERWEARCLRDMSHAYIEGLGIGKNPLGKPPWEN